MRARGVSPIYINAATKRHIAAVRFAVRFEEGQRCTGNGLQRQVIAGIEFQLGNILLTAGNILVQDRADVGFAADR